MYKQTITSDELAESMRRTMLAEAAEEKTHASKLENALQCLIKSADIFDDIGLINEANCITYIIEKLAGE